MRTLGSILLHAGIMLFLVVTSVSQVFSPAQNVAPNLGLSAGTPRAAFGSDGTAYVIWQDQNMPAGKHDFDIFFARSDKHLQRLSTPRPLGSLPGEAYNNVIMAHGHAVYVTWEEFDPDGPDTNYMGERNDVMFTASHDDGATFTPPVSVNPATPSSITPQLAVAPDGTAYVAWADFRTGDIYLRASHDQGRTLGPMVNISNDAAYSSEPQLAVDSHGTVHIAWTSEVPGGTAIFYAHSPDGSIFSTPQNLTATMPGSPYSPLITVSSRFVYVAWKGDRLRLSRSSDGGVTFELPQDISHDVGDPTPAQIAVAGSNVYVLFTGYVLTYQDFIARSNDRGSTFKRPLKLSNSWSESPHVSATGDRVDLVWTDRSNGNFEVRHARSIDGGRHWSRVQNISKSRLDSIDSWVATRPDGDLVITWTENAEDPWWSVGRNPVAGNK
jgi:hypothetical protein